MIKPIRILDVKPRIPERLQPLYELGNNLYFAWHHDADELFKGLTRTGGGKQKGTRLRFSEALNSLN